MTSFPLYDSLNKDLENEEMGIKEQTKFIKMISNFDITGNELIYILIRIYQQENNDDKSTFKLPYGGKYVKDDITFDFNEFPNDLKKILYKFAKIHLKKLKEEKENETHKDISLDDYMMS